MEQKEREPLIGKTLAELQGVAAEVGLKPFASKQMAQWLYEKRVTDIDSMTNLSKAARQKLAEKYVTGREEPLAQTTSADGTVKYLFRGAPGRDVEAVYIPDRDRATLCVSSQAGCKMSCTFCMTGRQGFHGNLTSAQIINQILSIPGSESLTNIVFMGMGEPADNITEVLKTIDILTSGWGMAWSPKRITLSSIGKIGDLKKALDQTRVQIAISIHSPYSEERARLMPVERAYPIKDVLRLLAGYDFSHQRRLSFEYIMWKGVNDDMAHADALAKLLKPLDCRVNLIRYHSLPGLELKPCSESVMTTFRDRLNAQGITATIRASRGQDIDAACGMLAGKGNVKTNDK